MLSADYDGCYYVTPAYSTSLHHHLTAADNGTAGASDDDDDDWNTLAGLIDEFNTNNHGLIMTLVSK